MVGKLFNQVQPDLALFGEKDWQQLLVIRRMALDLDLTHPRADAILDVATRREPDGLAMSSRNAYLTAAERTRAAALPAAMRQAIADIHQGEPAAPVLAALRATLLAAGFSTVDYAELRNAESLGSLDRLDGAPARLLVAARIGGTRLLDNMPLG